MTDAEEKDGIEKMLKETDGNAKETAIRLKMPYRMMLRRIHKYGIVIERGRKKQRIVLPGEM